MGGGVFNYSPFMLRLFWFLHLSPSLTLFAGVLLCLAYCLILGILPPARSWRGLGVRFITAASPSAWFALEQGNFDVCLFVILSASIWMLTRSWPVRLTGYGLILFGFLLKFYPAALLPLAARENRLHFIIATLSSLTVFSWFLFCFHQTFTGATILPAFGEPFKNTFGATNLPAGLMILSALFQGHIGQGADFNYSIPRPNADFMDALILCVVLAALLTRRKAQKLLCLIPLDETLFLIGGALATAFCFLATQNASYRAIYLCFVLPGIWRVQSVDRGARMMLLTVLIVLWEAAIRTLLSAVDNILHTGIAFTVLFWLLRELLWWWLVLEFLRLIFAFTVPHLGRLLRGQN